MPTMTPMTELEAVNEMLMSIGQAPVNTLAVSGIKDVSIAHGRLLQATRRVLTRGFAFNTDENQTVEIDVDGVAILPPDVLRLEAMDGGDYTMRRHPDKGLAVWDKSNNTFVFTTAPVCRLIRAFPFEDLPDTARNYIAVFAARRFQSKVVGSQVLDGYEAEDEQRAWILLEREERAVRKTNLFRANARIAGFGSRQH